MNEYSCEHELDLAEHELFVQEAKIADLKKALKHLYEVAVDAVEHVGYANYAERERDALRWIRQAYDDALPQEEV